MIFNKAEEKGIKVVENEESYTSKCDSINWEDVKKHDEYSGKRIKRGLFSSGKHVLINADVNGAINIMRKGLRDNNNLLLELKEWLEDYKNFCNPEVVKIKYDQKRTIISRKDKLKRQEYSIVNRIKREQIKAKSFGTTKTMANNDISNIGNNFSKDFKIIIDL